jgi:hypothetical protein
MNVLPPNSPSRPHSYPFPLSYLDQCVKELLMLLILVMLVTRKTLDSSPGFHSLGSLSKALASNIPLLTLVWPQVGYDTATCLGQVDQWPSGFTEIIGCSEHVTSFKDPVNLHYNTSVEYPNSLVRFSCPTASSSILQFCFSQSTDYQRKARVPGSKSWGRKAFNETTNHGLKAFIEAIAVSNVGRAIGYCLAGHNRDSTARIRRKWKTESSWYKTLPQVKICIREIPSSQPA